MQNKTVNFSPLNVFTYYCSHFSIVTSHVGGDQFFISVFNSVGNLLEQQKIEISSREFFETRGNEVLDNNFESLKTKYIFELS